MRAEDAQELADYFKAAARLRSEIAPFEDDQKLVRKGGKVFYAVDTNIVRLFLDPRTDGPRRDSAGGYTHVFPGDEDRVAEALAAALSRYIFYRLNRFSSDPQAWHVPLLLLDGHDAEIRTTYDRLVLDADAKTNRHRNDVEELRELLRELEGVGNVGAAAERVRFAAQAIIEWLYLENSAPAQAARLSELLSAGRLARIPVVVERLAELSPPEHRHAAREAFGTPKTLIETLRESRFRTEWEKRLNFFKTTKRKNQNILVDAGALARLEAINGRIEPLGMRVCLITADNAMINAAAGYRENPDAPSFCDRFIRHPRAFLAANEVLTPARGTRETENDDLGLLSNWLDTLLARLTDDRGPSQGDLLKWATTNGPDLLRRTEHLLRGDERAMETLRMQWTAHTDAIRNEHAASSNLAQEEIQRLLGRSEFMNLHATLDRVQSVLSAASDKTWDNYYLAVVRTGYDLVDVGDGAVPKRRRRNAPAIDFQSFSCARDFVRTIIAARGLGRFARGEVDKRLADIERQGGGYAMLLAYAVLFADAGRWHVGLLTAKRAITVARLYREGNLLDERVPDVPGSIREKVSGREAYYFVAVAQRLTARDLADVEKAEQALANARHALSLDLARKNPPTHSELRFEAEDIAIALTRLLFSRFAANEISEPELADGAANVARRAADLARRAADLADEWTRRLVERSALTNLFMADALVSGFNLSGLDRFEIKEMAERFVAILEADKESATQELPVTELVTIVGLYAEARYGSLSRTRRRTMAHELLVFENEIESDRAGLMMPYDFGRYTYLVGIARQHLAERV